MIKKVRKKYYGKMTDDTARGGLVALTSNVCWAKKGAAVEIHKRLLKKRRAAGGL